MACTRSIIGGAGVATASSQLSTSYLPSYAFDGITITAWVNGGSLPAWLQYTLAAQRLVCGYSIRFNFVSGITQLRFAPAAWTLQGSQDAVGWKTVDTRSAQVFANPEVKSYTLATPRSYRYWRLNVTANQDASASAAIVELVLYERPMVSAAIVQSYGLKTGADLIQSYADAPVVQLPLLQPYGDAGLLVASLVQRWRDMVILQQPLTQPWAITASLAATLAQAWAITADVVQGGLIQAWDLRERTYLINSLQTLWWGDFDPSAVTAPAISCEVYAAPAYGSPVNVPGAPLGGLVGVTGMTLEASLDQYAISATIQTVSQEDYLLCVPGAFVNVSGAIPGDTVTMRVDSRSRNRSGADVDSYSIELLSPAAWLDDPYADPVDGEFSGTAASIATQLVAGLLPVSWEVVDWPIGPGILVVENQTPLSILRSLASAVGGVLQSKSDGTLQVISRYPVSVPAWGSSAGISVNEATSVTSCTDTFQYQPGYNRYRISDEEATSALSDIRITVDDSSDHVKIVKAQIPNLANLVLTHTGGSWVVIEPLGRNIVPVTEPEVVEIVEGEGRTVNTILTISSSTWKYFNLGTVSFEASGLIMSSIQGESLLDLEYSYEEQTWRVSSPEIEKVQFVLEIDNG